MTSQKLKESAVTCITLTQIQWRTFSLVEDISDWRTSRISSSITSYSFEVRLVEHLGVMIVIKSWSNPPSRSIFRAGKLEGCQSIESIECIGSLPSDILLLSMVELPLLDGLEIIFEDIAVTITVCFCNIEKAYPQTEIHG